MDENPRLRTKPGECLRSRQLSGNPLDSSAGSDIYLFNRLIYRQYMEVFGHRHTSPLAKGSQDTHHS
jgi:hypothetical protein